MASPTSENAPNSTKFQDEWNSDELAAKWKLAEAGTKPWASIMIEQSGITSSNEDAYALDLACGTGVVTATIYELLPRDNWSRVKVMGSDVSESMVSSLAKRAEAAKWPAVETKVTSGIDPGIPSDTLTHVFINLGIYLMPADTLSTAFDKVRPGGFVGVSCMAVFAWYDWFAHAASKVTNPPTMPPYSEVMDKLYVGRPWGDPQYMETALKEAGAERVHAVVEKRLVDCGTPEQFVGILHMPLLFMSSWWPDEGKDQLVESVEAELLQFFAEKAEKAEGGRVLFEGECMVGCAWKAV